MRTKFHSINVLSNLYGLTALNYGNTSNLWKTLHNELAVPAIEEEIHTYNETYYQHENPDVQVLNYEDQEDIDL